MFPLATTTLAFFVAAAVPSVSPNPQSLAIPAEQAARARELVKQLSSDLYRERDRATRELEKMGRLALPALETARTDSDPEVRLRSRLLLPKAEADDLRARVDTFLADTESKFDHDLPGWRRFRAVAGDSKSSRDLFAQVLKNPANFDLLIAIKGVSEDTAQGAAAAVGSVVGAAMELPPSAELTRAIVSRRQKLVQSPSMQVVNGNAIYRQPVVPELPDVAIVLLAETYISERLVMAGGVAGTNQYVIANYLYQQPAQDALAGKGSFGPAFRSLAIHWMDTRDHPNSITTAMSIASMQRLGAQKIGAYAAKLMKHPSSQTYSRASALATIARNGAKEYLFEITGQFKDTTLLVRGAPNGGQFDILMKDLALAMALLVSGQDPKDYGFETGNTTPAAQYSYTNYRFRGDETATSEQKREAAFARWQQYELGLHMAASGPAGAALVVKKYTPKTDDAGAKKAPK